MRSIKRTESRRPVPSFVVGAAIMLAIAIVMAGIVGFLAFKGHNSDRADKCDQAGGLLVQRAPVGATLCVRKDAVIPMKGDR